MPYFSDPNMDDEESKGQAQGQVAGPSGVITGANGGGQQGGEQVQGAPSRSGSWSNLMSYIDANQGNDSQVGGQIKSAIGKDASQANDSQKQFQDAANKAVNDQTSANQTAINSSKNTAITGFKEPLGQQYKPSYNGPASADQINQYAQAKQQAENVQKTAKLSGGNESDRVSLLDKTFARPGYTQGEKALDSFILGGGQGGKAALSDITQTYGNYGDRFKTLADSVSGNLNKVQAETKQANDAVKQNLQTKAQEYKQQLDAKVAAENAKRQAEESQNQYLGGQSGAARDFISQQSAKTYQDLMGYLGGLSEREQVGGANAQRYALEQIRPQAVGWTSTSPNETSGPVPFEALGQQFYQGAGDLDAASLATADEASGYNNLLAFLGEQGNLTPKEAQQRTFNSEGYKQALMNKANRYISQNESELRRKGIL